MDKALICKLLQFQKEVTAIKKDLENPYFKSQYFDVNAIIEVIRPILNKIGLVVLQPLGISEGKNVIWTEIYDADTGEKTFGITQLPENLKPQEMGSAITYFRRYSLVSTLLLQGEIDDDGNVASQAKPKQTYVLPEKRKIVPTPTVGEKDLPF